MKRLRVAFAIVMAALLSSCGTSAVPSALPTEVTSVTWLLNDLDGTPTIAGAPITLRLDANGSVYGSAGCNRFTGRHRASANRITIDNHLAVTRMTCADAVMSLERAFLDRIRYASGFTLDGDTLTITGLGVGPLTFSAETQELAGSTWRVLRHHDGGTAVVSVLEGVSPEITFGKDGTMSGFGGCNLLIGSYAAGAGKLRFDTIASTQMACPSPEDALERESQMIAAIESTTSFSVEGDRLELRRGDGQLVVALIKIK